jgi:hypothetical protein
MAARWTKINILDKNFVEVAFDIPPVSCFVARDHLGKEVLSFTNCDFRGVACSAITLPVESASSSKSLPASCHKSRDAS